MQLVQRIAAMLVFVLGTSEALAAEPLPPPLPSPVPPVPSGLPERYETTTIYEPPPAAPGQQHWIAVNLLGGQPSLVRVGVKVWPRENNSLWLEAYSGSVLWDYVYGFGLRVQHTAWGFANGDSVLVSPGLGLHVLPDWYADL